MTAALALSPAETRNPAASRPTVSVVIPTCDRPDFLREAVASVLRQSLPPHEIIIVDNGSFALQGSDLPEGVTLLRTEPRIGPSRARNQGAAAASGQLVAFLDDDDWWAEDFLREAVFALVEQDVSCVYGRKCRATEHGVQPYRLPTPETLTVPTLLRRNPGTGGMNLLIDRLLFLRLGGFDPDLLLSEDRALALELLLAGERIGIAPDALAIVRTHDSDRLRRHGMRKLGFIRKYRRLYSAAGLASAYARLIGGSLAGHLRRQGEER